MTDSNLSDNTEEKEQKKVKIVLDKIVEIIKEPELLENTLMNLGNDRYTKSSLISIYSNICILITEIKEFYPEINWEEISYGYMLKIRSGLYSVSQMDHTALFPGLPSVGFGAYALSKDSSYYNKFLNGLNQLIIDKVKERLKIYQNNIGNMKAECYDIIFGLSGTAAYLLLFKEDKEVENTIKEILEYLVKITEDINIQGNIVPGWHISSKNQAVEAEKIRYKNGNFNLGMSHGITGPLAVMSIAIKEGIEVEGQREGINKILKNLKRFYTVDEEGLILWPGKIDFEDYLANKAEQALHYRASWCYGQIGIARAMYLAGTAVKDNDSVELAIKVIEGVCTASVEKWRLNSPTFCHGYAGLLAIVQAMYKDTNNKIFNIGRKRIEKILLEYYDDKLVLGFYNVESRNSPDKGYEIIKTDAMDILEGTVGIMLAILSTTPPIRTNWTRMFALD